jgi:O-antigen ligase
MSTTPYTARSVRIRSRSRAQFARMATAAVAFGLGAGVAASGFDPVNNATSTLDIDATPLLVILSPPVLLGLGAALAALLVPADKAPAIPAALRAGGWVLLGAACISLFASDEPTRTALTVVLAICAPMLLVVGLVRSALDRTVICAAFLAGITLLLLRAIGVFVSSNGIPTPSKLEDTKFANQAFDFHYYTLGNPDHTAGFLLMPFVLALLWALDSRINWRARVLLLSVAAVTFVGIVMTYVRFGAVTALIVIVAVATISPVGRWARRGAIGVAALLTVTFVAATFRYLGDLLTGGSVPERVRSLGDGLSALADKPIAGVGLSRFEEPLYVPAHSSIIQAGAEMGVLGLCAMTLLTGALIWLAARVVKAEGWFGLRPAAALAVAIYAVYAALAAPAAEGLYADYIAIYGLAAAMLVAVSLKPAGDGSS